MTEDNLNIREAMKEKLRKGEKNIENKKKPSVGSHAENRTPRNT